VSAQKSRWDVFALFSGDRGREVAILQPLEAFFDESGTHRGSRILSVGACLGSHEQWQNFLKCWTVANFHSKERRYERLKPKNV
jgi:hypothetical protein